MDLQTLIIVLIIANFLQSIALVGLYRVGKATQGPGCWTLGSVLVTLGFVLHGLRKFPSLEQGAILGNNVFFFAGLALLYTGLLRFLGRQLQIRWLAVSGFLFTLLIGYFTCISTDLSARRILLSIVVTIFSFLIARALLRYSPPSIAGSSRFLAAVFSLYGLFFLLRLVATCVDTPVSNIFASTVTQSVTYLITLIVSTLWTFGLILLVNQRLNSEIREVSERFESIFATSPDAVLITRMSDGCYVDINEGFTSLTGYAKGDVLGKSAIDLNIWCNQSDRAKVFSAIAEYGHCENLEAEFKGKDNRQIFGSLSAKIVYLKGTPHIISVTRDIAERKRAEKMLEESNRKLEALSITDGLTAISNRRHFDEVLAKEHARHSRSGAELSLIFLDIDYFKAFNDTYGHVRGDECLRQIGQVLADSLDRPADLAARYGGEEFACILPETDLSGAVALAEKMRRSIQALAIPHKTSVVAPVVTASLGVVTVECRGEERVEDILSKADELLYQAKSSGRNRVEFMTGSVALLSMEEISGSFVRLLWKDTFRCGHPVIDSQHQTLFRSANELFGTILSGQPSSQISVVIDRLLADVAQHFHDEQELLEKSGFSGLEQHCVEHDRLLVKGCELSKRFKEETLTVGDLFQFLACEVIMLHILGADRDYFPSIEKKDITE